jgi:formate dehydrogenase subunit gamma
MSRRALVSAGIALVFVLGLAYAVRSASRAGAELLFDSGFWLVALAPFAGILAAGLTRRKDPRVEGDRVLRHDDAAILEHWTHGIGTAFLLVSGIALGLLFVPRLVGSGAPVWAAMNIHFVAVVLFLFGTFYYGANTVLSWHRLGEHLPTKNAFSFTIQHYGHLLGVKKYEMPPEDKYFESEKMAYILALASTIGVIVTGLIKALAHVVGLPGGLVGAATLVHDVSTVAMLAFFLAHVFFAAILPNSWPVLRSMFTGYVTKEQAQKEHAGWYRRLTEKGGSPE